MSIALKLAKIKSAGRLKELKALKPLPEDPTDDEFNEFVASFKDWLARLEDLYGNCIAAENAQLALKRLSFGFDETPPPAPGTTNSL